MQQRMNAKKYAKARGQSRGYPAAGRTIKSYSSALPFSLAIW